MSPEAGLGSLESDAPDLSDPSSYRRQPRQDSLFGRSRDRKLQETENIRALNNLMLCMKVRIA